MRNSTALALAQRATAPPTRGAFTLIELLIVVTIIAILAAIALPNFLEAQTRSKVARVKADMHALATAIESYRVDGNHYPYRQNETANPPTSEPATPQATKRAQRLSQLTTPIGYISSLPVDLFESHVPAPNNIIDYYDPEQTSWLLNATHPRSYQPGRRVPEGGAGWLLVSVGPDTYLGAIDNSCACPLGDIRTRGTVYFVYDPTNGTVSKGNIYDSSSYGMDGGASLTRQFYSGN